MEVNADKIKMMLKGISHMAFSSLFVWLSSESVLGLRQAFGHAASCHALFSMTGSFRNPGPFGGFIAIMTAVAISYAVIHRKSFISLSAMLRMAVSGKRAKRPLLFLLTVFRAIPFMLAVIASVLGIVVLPASMSRAAWLAFALAILILAVRESGLPGWITGHRLLACACGAAAVCLMAGAFCMKKDSAVGRLHIWHMELLAMSANPWRGTGKGTVLGTYGKTQAAYFAEKERSGTEIRVAGCPEYAFNEYFRIGVEYGVPAMLAATAALVFAVVCFVRCRSPFGYGLAAFAVFAFFSYPLSLFHCEGEAGRSWKELRCLSSCDMYDDAVGEYGKLYGELHGCYRFLYDYGYALHKSGRYAESNKVLAEGAEISSDPMSHNIMGRNYEALGMYAAAEQAYMTSHNMVPCRIYPLLLLMEMYMSQERFRDAVELGRRIQAMPLNPRLRSMKELRQRADDNLAEVMRLQEQHETD